MKMLPDLKPAFLFLAVITLPFTAHAQTCSTPLTPEQQNYVNVRDQCLAQYNEQQIPFSQFHTFMNACFRQNSITQPVALPQPAAPATSTN